MLIVGVVAVGISSRLMPSSLLQIQSDRDLLISALFVAQQKAMSLTSAVQLTTSASIIDIRVDTNDDSIFSPSESIATSGTTYPFTVPGGSTLSTASIGYNRLGHTPATSITLNNAANSVIVTVSGTGYAY